MSRRKKDPLRALSTDERGEVERLSRSGRESATVVAHAKAVLAVATGANYTEAAARAGRRSGDAVALHRVRNHVVVFSCNAQAIKSARTVASTLVGCLLRLWLSCSSCFIFLHTSSTCQRAR